VKPSAETQASEAIHERPFRCACGSLLARLVRDGLELKCRKCKRQIVVRMTEDRSWTKIDL
jgi:phage FluMu protein Com